METMAPAYGQLCSLFYEALHGSASEKEVAFYASFMPRQGRVLEAMVGTGRLLIPLVEQGYCVDGVDASPHMLERCRVRALERGLATDLYVQNLETLALPHQYDTITISIGSFQLLTEKSIVHQVLQRLRLHLKPGGALLFDVFRPDPTDEPSVRMVRLDRQRTIRSTMRYVFDHDVRIAHAICWYELLVNGVVHEQENELLQVTWYEEGEVEEILSQNGFSIVGLHDVSFHATDRSRVIHAQLN